MADNPIQKFWTKLMVASQSINKIPEEYMRLAMNARIRDGGIWPRRWKILLTNSSIGTVNQGAFIMNNTLYQVADSKIYSVNTTTWVQTEVADLGYDSRVDILVYRFPRWPFTAAETINDTYTVPFTDRWRRFTMTTPNNVEISIFNPDTWNYDFVDSVSWTWMTNNALIPSIKVIAAWTDWLLTVWAGWGTQVWDDVILWIGDFVSNNPTGNASNNIRIEFGSFQSQEQAIIVSDNNTLKVFDGTSTFVNEQDIENNGIIEFTRGFSFLAQGNIMRISSPVTIDNPENAYDFTSANSQTISYDEDILGLHETMNGLYVFSETKVEFLGSNSLQNVSGSATFISTPLGTSWSLINNQCVASIGDKIFYVTKDLQIQSINYIGGTDSPVVWELSAKPVIGIKELLNTIDTEQPYAFAHYNKKEKTVQFHLRRINSKFNDVIIVYDFINDTWDIDTNKNYNWVLEDGNTYYWFSDVNTSIYRDDEWFSDAWIAIPFLIRTQAMNRGTLMQKRFTWFYTAWAVWPITNIEYSVSIDWQRVFRDSVEWNESNIIWLWEIADAEIGLDEVAWPLTYEWQRQVFDRTADQGRIRLDGVRIQFDIFSWSQIQDFIIDMLGYMFEPTRNIDINSKF